MGQKVTKMAYFGSFLTTFWTTLFIFIYVCLILRVNCVHIWVEHEKDGPKRVQKWEHGLTTRIFRQNWVIFHLFSRLPASAHLEL